MSTSHDRDFQFHLFTRRNVVLFLSSFTLIAGMASASRATFGFGIFLLTLIIFEWLEGRRLPAHLYLQRLHYPRAFEGDVVTVDLKVENRSPRDAHLVEVIDAFSPSGNYHIAQVAPDLPAGEGVLFRYRQTCKHHRGIYLIGPMRLRTHSPVGLFTFNQTREIVTTLHIHPQAVGIMGFEILGRGTLLEIGEAVVRRIGRGEQFAQLRDYRAGDPPRYIHWPSTARRGYPLVKEFEQNVVSEITIYCDLHLLSLAGLGNNTSLEMRIKAAASIAAEAIPHQHLVRVVAVKDPMDMTTLAAGREHLTAILDWLALLKAEGVGSFEAPIMKEAELLRPGSTAVLVLSSINMKTEATAKLVQLLVLRRVKAICVLVDDRSFLKLRTEQDQAFADAPPLDQQVGMLKEAGADLFTVLNQQHLATQLRLPS